jgi:anti-anti-sigma factor
MQDDAGTIAPATGVGSSLQVDASEHDAVAVVLLSGDLDLDSAPQLRDALDRLVVRGCRDVVVDVSRLHFCGAVGLGILVATAQGLPSGGGLTLVGATGMLRRLLHVTGVDEVVRVEPVAVSR